VFDNRSGSEADSLSKAILAAKEWQSAQAVTKVPPPLPLPADPTTETFTTVLPLPKVSPPLPRTEALIPIPLTKVLPLLPRTEVHTNVPHAEEVFCFTDAAWIASSSSCGMGWIFKTHDQRVIHRGSSTRLHTPSALAAEALSLREALSAASRMDFNSIKVLSDSKVLISLLTTETTTNELQGILHDIALLRRSFISCSFHFIPRKLNFLADVLAKSALAPLNSPV